MPSINGNAPDLNGVPLESLICTQLWQDGALHEYANVVYLRVHARWYRLYFDYAVVFWRNDVDEPPEYDEPIDGPSAFVNVDLGHDLGIAGRTIKTCVAEMTGDSGARVTFSFDGGGLVSFICIDDRTNVEHYGLLSRGT